MSPTLGYRILAAAGLLLAVVMGVLARVGTTSEATFVTWIVLMFVGIGVFALGRKLDSDTRKRRLDAERAARLQNPSGT